MNEYEFIFEIETVDDDRAMEIMNDVDCFFGGHSGLHLITITSEGPSAVKAGIAAFRTLDNLGITVHRPYPDLVDRSAIAARTSRTRQAVGNWVRGDRQSGFPLPYSLAGGGIWYWPEVAEWLEKTGVSSESIMYPSRAELETIARQRPKPIQTFAGNVQLQLAPDYHPIPHAGGFNQFHEVFDVRADELEVCAI